MYIVPPPCTCTRISQGFRAYYSLLSDLTISLPSLSFSLDIEIFSYKKKKSVRMFTSFMHKDLHG